MGQELRKWGGHAWRIAAALCALVATGFAGCEIPVFAAYGPGPVPRPLDITSFSYTPPSPIHVGDTLTFAARISGGTVDHANIHIPFPDSVPGYIFPLHDDGQAPDVTAGDGIYSARGQWTVDRFSGALKVRLEAYGGVDKDGSLIAYGVAELPLEVMP